MKYALNMSNLRSLGTAVVGKNILAHMSSELPNIEFHAWIPLTWRNMEEEIGTNISLHYCKPGMINKLLVDNLQVRSQISLGCFDRLFSVGDTSFPFCHVPQLLMIHSPYLAYPPSEWDFNLTSQLKIKYAILKKYLCLGLPSVSAITVQTVTMKNRIAEIYGFPRNDIYVVPSSVDLHAFDYDYKSLNSSDNPYVLFAASSALHKNHIVLVDMMVELKRRGIEMSCYVTVSPADIPLVVSKAREMQVLDRFKFLGNVSQQAVFGLMSNAIALVMPSKLETYGLPYYEAMAMGCPVIAADRDFAREAMGTAGLYANADRGNEFAEHVAMLINSFSYRKQVSQNVKKRLEEVYVSWPKIVSKYVHILQNIS